MDHINLMYKYFIETMVSCWYCAGLKVLLTALVSIAIFLFGANNLDMAIGIFVLTSFDAITGMAAAKINKQPVTSKAAWKTPVKWVAYGILLAASFKTGEIIPSGQWIFVATAGWLAVTELISVMENVGKMGYTVPQKILNQLKELRDEK